MNRFEPNFFSVIKGGPLMGAKGGEQKKISGKYKEEGIERQMPLKSGGKLFQTKQTGENICAS
jgi:hypothetical protein